MLSLPEAIRGRVWWLFYSGSGYRALSSAQPNVHYLAYLVQSKVMYPEDARCFCNLLEKLRAECAIDSKASGRHCTPQAT